MAKVTLTIEYNDGGQQPAQALTLEDGLIAEALDACQGVFTALARRGAEERAVEAARASVEAAVEAAQATAIAEEPS